jgi:hypothetical protein
MVELTRQCYDNAPETIRKIRNNQQNNEIIGRYYRELRKV